MPSAKNKTAVKELPRFPLKLVGENGNAFLIIGKFSRAARKAGWSQQDIERVREEITAGDYDHLLQTVMKYADVE